MKRNILHNFHVFNSEKQLEKQKFLDAAIKLDTAKKHPVLKHFKFYDSLVRWKNYTTVNRPAGAYVYS